MKLVNKIMWLGGGSILLVFISLHMLGNEALAAEGADNWRPIFDWVMRIVNFAILAFLLIKFSRAPIKDFFKSRQKELASQINALEKEKQDALREVDENLKLLEESSTRFFNDMALQASQRAKELVKQILTFSRQSEQKLAPLRLDLIIKENLKLMRSAIPSTIKINKNVETNIGYVNADPTQIHQLIMNLCINAVHAMDEKGTLSVTLREVELSSDELIKEPELEPGSYVMLAVRDNGCGIPAEIDIHEPKTLGLHLIVILVKYQLTGKLEVNFDQGTEYRIEFPRLGS